MIIDLWILFMIYSVSKNKFWYYLNNSAVFVFFLLHFLQMYTGSTIFFVLDMFIIPVYLIQKIKVTNDTIIQSLSLLGMYSLFLLTNIRNQNVFAGCFLNLQYIFIALLLSQKKISQKVFLAGIILQVVFFAPKIISGINPNTLLQGGSRNVVSAMTINQMLLYYGHVYKNKKKIMVWPAIACFLFCLICIGRSGIIISGGILFFVFIYWFRSVSIKHRVFLCITFVIILVFFGNKILEVISTMGFNNNSMNFIQNFQRVGLKSDGRDKIKIEYLDIIWNDLPSFIFGIKNINSNPVFRAFDGNFHNSFFTLHTSYSILGFLFIIFLTIFVSFISLFEKKFFILLLYYCALIRITKDILAFPGFYDPFLYFAIFYIFSWFRNNKIIKKYLLLKG